MLHNTEPLTFAAADGQVAPPAPPQMFEDYYHTVHPDTGVEVVFCPGETIPSWCLERLQAPEVDEPGEPVKRGGNRAVKAQEAADSVA